MWGLLYPRVTRGVRPLIIFLISPQSAAPSCLSGKPSKMRANLIGLLVAWAFVSCSLILGRLPWRESLGLGVLFPGRTRLSATVGAPPLLGPRLESASAGGIWSLAAFLSL